MGSDSLIAKIDANCYKWARTCATTTSGRWKTSEAVNRRSRTPCESRRFCLRLSSARLRNRHLVSARRGWSQRDIHPEYSRSSAVREDASVWQAMAKGMQVCSGIGFDACPHVESSRDPPPVRTSKLVRRQACRDGGRDGDGAALECLGNALPAWHAGQRAANRGG